MFLNKEKIKTKLLKKSFKVTYDINLIQKLGNSKKEIA